MRPGRRLRAWLNAESHRSDESALADEARPLDEWQAADLEWRRDLGHSFEVLAAWAIVVFVAIIGVANLDFLAADPEGAPRPPFELNVNIDGPELVGGCLALVAAITVAVAVTPMTTAGSSTRDRYLVYRWTQTAGAISGCVSGVGLGVALTQIGSIEGLPLVLMALAGCALSLVTLHPVRSRKTVPMQRILRHHRDEQIETLEKGVGRNLNSITRWQQWGMFILVLIPTFPITVLSNPDEFEHGWGPEELFLIVGTSFIATPIFGALTVIPWVFADAIYQWTSISDLRQTESRGPGRLIWRVVYLFPMVLAGQFSVRIVESVTAGDAQGAWIGICLLTPMATFWVCKERGWTLGLLGSYALASLLSSPVERHATIVVERTEG